MFKFAVLAVSEPLLTRLGVVTLTDAPEIVPMLVKGESAVRLKRPVAEELSNVPDCV